MSTDQKLKKRVAFLERRLATARWACEDCGDWVEADNYDFSRQLCEECASPACDKCGWDLNGEDQWDCVECESIFCTDCFDQQLETCVGCSPREYDSIPDGEK
jgi:hypothetical protein